MDTTVNPTVIDETKPKRGPGGLFAKKEAAADKPPKIEYIGVEEPKRGRGRPKGSETKAASSSKPATMTPKKARDFMAAACTVASIVSRNPAYMMTPQDEAMHKETFAQIADGMNAMPDWLRSGVAQGSGVAGLVAGLALFGMSKHALATGKVTYAQLEHAAAMMQEAA